MNFKKILLSGTSGGFVDFLLGWLFYGFLFNDLYPEGESMNLFLVFLGCMTNGYFISYVITNWVQPINFTNSISAGALIGFFTSLSMNLFMYSNMLLNYKNMAIDIIITIVMSSLVALTVFVINSKIK